MDILIEYPVAFIGQSMKMSILKLVGGAPPFWYSQLPILDKQLFKRLVYAKLFGIFYTPASEEIVQKLESETKDMPSYPDSGSIKVIDGTVVVKRG